MNKLLKNIVTPLNVSFLVGGALGVNALSLSSAQAARLKITVENTSTSPAVFLTPFWMGLHDGSFDTFTPGGEASLGLEIVAEDGLTGLEPIEPAFAPIIETAIALDAVLPGPGETISELFSSQEPNGIQKLAFFDVFGFSPGTQSSFTIDVDPSTQNTLSYASMILPSQDAFVADVDPIALFSDTGSFLPTTIEVLTSDIYDAGTETNVEDPLISPVSFDNLPLFFGAFRQGEEEGGVIQEHPLLDEPGEGGYLDIPRFSDSDYTRAADARVARITIELVPVPEPSVLLGLGITTTVGALLKSKKTRNKS